MILMMSLVMTNLASVFRTKSTAIGRQAPYNVRLEIVSGEFTIALAIF